MQQIDPNLLLEVLNAEIIIVPDVGCGVFGNDPYVIGGCGGLKLSRVIMAKLGSRLLHRCILPTDITQK